MGKRALGQLSLFDLVIMVGIGDVIIVIALDQKIPFERGIIILGILGGLELTLSKLTYRSRFFARLLEGTPTLLIKDGVPIEDNLAKEHISWQDLKQELRKQGIANLSQVSRGVLEACGKFSVILKEEEPTAKQDCPLTQECPLTKELLRETILLREELQNIRQDMFPPKEN